MVAKIDIDKAEDGPFRIRQKFIPCSNRVQRNIGLTGRRDNRYGNPDADCLCCFSFLFGQTQSRPASDIQVESEGFDELDGQALAQLFEFLNGQALEQQNRPRYNRVNNYQGTNYQILRRVQNAIGCLSPSEWEMRDLQYSDQLSLV